MLKGAVIGLSVLASAAAADDIRTIAGRSVGVVENASGGQVLFVDRTMLHTDGLILLDAEPVVIDGVTVFTGVAGAGGNGCNAAPFVLVVPETGAPELSGPIDSCAYLPIVDVQPKAIVFASEATPAEPGEVWVWNRTTGFTEALPEAFAPGEGTGWDQLDSLAGAHPADAMALGPVYESLVAGLGPDYDAFVERISGLGAGDLTPTGYLGSACIKFTCEADWAILYLHRETQQVFAIWHVYGEIENRIFPQDTNIWPPEAMYLLRDRAGD